MTKKTSLKKYFTGLFTNDWVITLTATLVGVFLALYLSERVSSDNIANQKKIATKNILTEISSNRDNIIKSMAKHTRLLDTYEFLSNHLDGEGNLIAAMGNMVAFRKKYPNLVTLVDSTLLESGKYKYKGEINMDLSITHLQLTSIALETLKNNGIGTEYDFECLMYLEQIDKLTKVVLKKDEELLEFLSGEKDSGNENENVIIHLESLIDFENSLQRIYSNSEDELKNCS